MTGVEIQVKAFAVLLNPSRDAQLVWRGSDDTKVPPHFHRLLGGHVEFGEATIDAIRREIFEETEAELQDPRLLGVLENRFFYQGMPGHRAGGWSCHRGRRKWTGWGCEKHPRSRSTSPGLTLHRPGGTITGIPTPTAGSLLWKLIGEPRSPFGLAPVPESGQWSGNPVAILGDEVGALPRTEGTRTCQPRSCAEMD